MYSIIFTSQYFFLSLFFNRCVCLGLFFVVVVALMHSLLYRYGSMHFEFGYHIPFWRNIWNWSAHTTAIQRIHWKHLIIQWYDVNELKNAARYNACSCRTIVCLWAKDWLVLSRSLPNNPKLNRNQMHHKGRPKTMNIQTCTLQSHSILCERKRDVIFTALL